jgi:hypothetical protein
MNRIRFSAVLALAATTSVLAACSDTSSPTQIDAPSFSKSGTAPSGGDRVRVDTSKSTSTDNSTSTGSTSKVPVGPTYTARIDSIGKIPTAMYYGTPSEWTIGGYIFHADYNTHLKATAGPLVVGACVSVDFMEYDGLYHASELKTVDQSKCD